MTSKMRGYSVPAGWQRSAEGTTSEARPSLGRGGERPAVVENGGRRGLGQPQRDGPVGSIATDFGERSRRVSSNNPYGSGRVGPASRNRLDNTLQESKPATKQALSRNLTNIGGTQQPEANKYYTQRIHEHGQVVKITATTKTAAASASGTSTLRHK